MTQEELKQLLVACNEIVKTLPIAHYLKVKTLNVEFSLTDPSSSFSVIEDKITIAFNNIANAIQTMLAKGEDVDDVKLEKTIRGLLYHEVSHAILTPISLSNYNPVEIRPFKKYIYDEKQQGRYPNLTLDLENIMEDERIETILAHYYNGVDFVENRKNVLTFIPQASLKSFEGFIFNLFRFRYCPNLLGNRVVNRCKQLVKGFINDSKSIVAFADRGCYYHQSALAQVMDNYLALLKRYYDQLVQAQQMLKQQQKQQQKQNQEDSQSEDGDTEDGNEDSQSEEETNENEDSSGNNEEEDNDTESDEEDSDNEEDAEETEEDDTESDTDSSEETESDSQSESNEEENDSQSEDTEEDAEDEEEQAEEPDTDEINAEVDDIDGNFEPEESICKSMQENARVSQTLSQQCGINAKKMTTDKIQSKNEIKALLLKIIGRNVGFGVKQNNATYGYSGRFNTKRFATDFNDSCKWFKKNSLDNTGVNAKKTNVKTLNIFLDQSGSYERNSEITNQILKSIIEIENKRDDFRFNLVKFGDRTRIAERDERVSFAVEGTQLDYEFERIYKQLNPTNSELNIFLCDGGCSRFYHIGVMNNKKCIIITEKENEKEARNYCPNALDIIIENSDYTGKLLNNVMRAMDLLF